MSTALLQEKMEQLEAQKARVREAQEHARRREEELNANSQKLLDSLSEQMTQEGCANMVEKMRLADEQREAAAKAREAQEACRAKELDVEMLRNQLKEKEEMMEAVLEQAQLAQQSGADASRAEKQQLVNTLQEEFGEERSALLEQLQRVEHEAKEAREQELLFNVTTGENQQVSWSRSKQRGIIRSRSCSLPHAALLTSSPLLLPAPPRPPPLPPLSPHTLFSLPPR